MLVFGGIMKDYKNVQKKFTLGKKIFLGFIFVCIVFIAIFGSRCDMRTPKVDEVKVEVTE